MLSILSHIVINSRLYHIGYCAVSFVIKRLMRNQIENRTFNHSNSKSKSKTDTTTFGKSALVNHSLIAIRLRVNVVCVCVSERLCWMLSKIVANTLRRVRHLRTRPFPMNAINYNWMRWFINLAVEFAFRCTAKKNSKRPKSPIFIRMNRFGIWIFRCAQWLALLCKCKLNRTKPYRVLLNLFDVFFWIGNRTGRHIQSISGFSMWTSFSKDTLFNSFHANVSLEFFSIVFSVAIWRNGRLIFPPLYWQLIIAGAWCSGWLGKGQIFHRNRTPLFTLIPC